MKSSFPFWSQLWFLSFLNESALCNWCAFGTEYLNYAVLTWLLNSCRRFPRYWNISLIWPLRTSGRRSAPYTRGSGCGGGVSDADAGSSMADPARILHGWRQVWRWQATAGGRRGGGGSGCRSAPTRTEATSAAASSDSNEHGGAAADTFTTRRSQCP